MKIANATRFQFREAYRHMRRNILEGNETKNPFVRAYKYTDAVWKAAFGDLYGVERFDVLICGPDHLLNLVLAFKASAEGRRVALYHTPYPFSDDYANALDQRINYFHPSFTALIELQLGLKGLGFGLQETIELLALTIDKHVDEDGNSLVFQLDSCRLFHDTLTVQDKAVRCWVEPTPPHHDYPTLERLLFWDQESARRFATEDGKFPEHCIEAQSIWLTGQPSSELGALAPSRVATFGEADRPLVSFEYFKGQDRLKDIADALGAKT
jgi:hypothetical protein